MNKNTIVIFFYIFVFLFNIKAQTSDKKDNFFNTDSLYYADTNLIKIKKKYFKVLENQDTDSLIKVSLKLSEYYKALDIIDSAKEYLYKAISLSDKKKDYNNLILSYITLAELLRATYHSDIADRYIYSAFEISFHKNIYTYLPYAYNRLAAIFFEKFYNKNIPQDTANIYKAIEYVDSSFFWSKKLNTEEEQISNYNILGACYSTLKDYEKSMFYLRKALELLKNKNDIGTLPYIYKNIAEVYYKIGNIDSAVFYAEKSANLANKYKLNEAAWFAYDLLTTIYVEENNYKKALYYHQKRDSIEEINRQLNADKKLREFKAEYITYQEKLLIQEQKKRIKYYTIFLSILIPLLLLLLITFFIIRQKDTKIKEQYEYLKIQNKKINQLHQFQINLMNMVVHDLKSPLNVIISQNEDKKIDFLAKKMLRLTENILDVYKQNNVKLEIHKTKFDIYNVIKNCVEEFNFLLQQKNISVDLNTTKINVIADKVLIERVICNIMSNAVKHAPNNGHIKIDFNKDQKNKISISIKNTGLPIDDSIIDEIFEMYKYKNPENSSGNSTGIGLAFCKMVIEEHGEKISAKNEKDGVSFNFTLTSASEIDKKNEEKVLPLEKINFTEAEIKILIPFVKILKEKDIFQTSDIIVILKDIPDQTDAIKKWKKQLQTSVFSSNEKLFKQLLDIIG